MKGLLKLLVPVAAMALALPASATAYKVSLSKNLTESKSVYQKQDVTSDEFVQISAFSKSDTEISGEGPLAALNKSTYGEVDETLIGLDLKGHSKLKLSMVGEQLYVTADMLVDDFIEGVKFYLPVKFSAPAYFVKGDWAEYQAGQEIEVKYTEEGLKLAAEAVVSRVQYAFRIVNKAIKAQLADADVSDVVLEKMKITGRGLLKGNIHRLELIGSPVVIKVSFTVDM